MMIDAASIIIRGLGFIAIFQGAGMAFFLFLFADGLDAPLARRLRRTAILSSAAALLLVPAHFLLEPSRMGGSFAAAFDPLLVGIALSSPLAVAAAVKLAGLVALCAGLLRASRHARAISLAGAALVLAGFTLTGHTRASDLRPLPGVLLGLHLAATAFWFGALVPLYQIARASPERAAAVTQRFSRLAMSVVPLLALAGVTMAILLLGSSSAIFTPYGLLLAFKTAIFAALMGLAALNRWRLGPALSTGSPQAALSFRRVVAVEYGLICAVLLITAALTSLYSPHS